MHSNDHMDLVHRLESIRRLSRSHGRQLPEAIEAHDQINDIAHEAVSFLLDDMISHVRRSVLLRYRP